MDLPSERWHRIVIEDAAWMAEFGAPFDLRELPGPMFQAHLAILRGRADRRRDDAPDEEDVPDNPEEVTGRGYRQ